MPPTSMRFSIRFSNVSCETWELSVMSVVARARKHALGRDVADSHKSDSEHKARARDRAEDKEETISERAHEDRELAAWRVCVDVGRSSATTLLQRSAHNTPPSLCHRLESRPQRARATA